MLPLIVTRLLIKRIASLGEPVRLYYRALRALVYLTFAVILFMGLFGFHFGLFFQHVQKVKTELSLPREPF